MSNLYYVQSVGPNLVMLSPVGGGYPDQGLPGFPGRPDQSLPWQPGHPSTGLPGGGHIDNSLPGAPGHPDNRPPGSAPPVVAPNLTLVLVRDQAGVWHYATVDNSSPPPKPVPVPPPGHASGQPVPVPPGGVAGQPLPPTAAPKPA